MARNTLLHCIGEESPIVRRFYIVYCCFSSDAAAMDDDSRSGGLGSMFGKNTEEKK